MRGGGHFPQFLDPQRIGLRPGIAAQIKALHQQLAVVRGEHEDGQEAVRGLRADLARHLQPALVGQVKVEDEQVEAALLQRGQALRGDFGALGLEAQLLQRVLDHLPEDR